jgi:hypothetical protein
VRWDGVESGGCLPKFQRVLLSLYSAQINIEVAGSSRASVKFCKTAQSVIPEESNLYRLCHKYHKFHGSFLLFRLVVSKISYSNILFIPAV